MSDKSAGWNEVVEVTPVAATPVLTPEAIARRFQEAARPTRRLDGENPMLRRLSPRRSLWPEIAAYDERARELEQRAQALNDEIAAREQALRDAGRSDRERLTEWQLGDGKGPRPEPTAPAIEREIEEKKADRAAALAARERVYADKARSVEKNRRRLVREADKATLKAQARYEEAIEEAERARGDLVDLRAAALWASLFPSELASQQADVGAVAANLRKPVESVLQLKTRLPADGVFRVLRSDAEILANAMTHDQALELGAANPQQNAALWVGTPEHQEQMRKERREALERFKREWGHYPA